MDPRGPSGRLAEGELRSPEGAVEGQGGAVAEKEWGQASKAGQRIVKGDRLDGVARAGWVGFDPGWR